MYTCESCMLCLIQLLGCRHSCQCTAVVSTRGFGYTISRRLIPGPCCLAASRARHVGHLLKQETAVIRVNKGKVPHSMMPRQKRKASGPIDSQQSSSNTDSPATPLQPLRRSGRNSAAFTTARSHEKGFGGDQTAGDVENRSERSPASEDKTRDGGPVSSEGVDAAIHTLAKMERRFKRAVKKQKLKLEESVVLVEADSIEQQAFKPDSTHISTGVLAVSAEQKAASIRKQQGTKTNDVGEEDPMSNEGEETMDIEDTLDSPERGPSRPPPVNSAYLPLPWKGRLGYVS